jgi:hypothetical protein
MIFHEIELMGQVRVVGIAVAKNAIESHIMQASQIKTQHFVLTG